MVAVSSRSVARRRYCYDDIDDDGSIDGAGDDDDNYDDDDGAFDDDGAINNDIDDDDDDDDSNNDDDDINNDDDDDKKSPHSSVFININSLISITIFHPINSPCFSHFLISSTTSLMIRIHHHLH